MRSCWRAPCYFVEVLIWHLPLPLPPPLSARWGDSLFELPVILAVGGRTDAAMEEKGCKLTYPGLGKLLLKVT